jgi:hypothetical protein
MEFDPWYRVVTPRKEVREGRSFDPDEFAIALEQVVAGNAPDDYKDPAKFFSRNYFTRALLENAAMVLRRLAGETANTAPVITLVTQFGGGKTHTLTVLYHLACNGAPAAAYPGVEALLEQAQLKTVPQAKVAVFVGNAWDPREGRETPWLDIAQQLAGEAGVAALGAAAKTTPPGTESLARLFQAALPAATGAAQAGGAPVLVLFDEVLNFFNRHRGMAEPFYAFVQNLTVAMTGTSRSAAVISLPRSKSEMTEWDQQWQEKITKVVRRVSKDLIVADESEISEVVRRRLFEDLGNERTRKRIAKAFSDWCFERRAQLPPEWTAVDTATTEAKAREFLQNRFEACYPFHPATLSVFQRKWQTLPQYQQTRGTLAMFAQWISWAYREAFTQARHEPLITLGSAPLDVRDFCSVVLGQLGESRLMTAIDFDIAAGHSHAKALDVDTKGALKDVHRRVGAAILFESSGGQTEKVAHLPELRFALCEPDVDTTSIDTAALTLESRAYYIRRVGSDGFRIYHKATLKKVVNDRRASLDETEVRQATKKLIQSEFEKGRTVPIEFFRGGDVSNTPKLTLQVVDPETEWGGSAQIRDQIAEWTKRSGTSDRLYPGALVWCLKKPGRELRDKVEAWLAWKRVKKEVDEGALGEDFEDEELGDIATEVREAEGEAKDEVWASYRFVLLADNQDASGLRVIDLGAGHASAGETLCGRVIAALKSNALLNESPGAGYLERKWPPAFKESGAWSLISLRQAFLTGALDRVLDPDAYLRGKIPEFVERGEFGLASGQKPDGTYERVWYKELLPSDEVTFESDVYLLKKQKAQELKSGAVKPPEPPPPPPPPPPPKKDGETDTGGETPPPLEPQLRQLHLFGDVPSEMWNRIGTKLIPKLRSGQDLKVGVEFTLTVNAETSKTLIAEINQILQDLGVADKVQVVVK